MTVKEAMPLRHTVRKFTEKPIEAGAEAQLRERIAANNRTHHLELQLVTGSADALNLLGRMVGRGVRNYLILAGEPSEDLDEKLGYCGADVMLFAQTLGLNSWWIGGMCNQKALQARLTNTKAVVHGFIVIGYGQTQGVPHRSKKPADISSYAGEAPAWFRDGVEALLLAPTAMNRQAFQVWGEGNRVSLRCTNGSFSAVDLGIGRYHFELGAGKENFEWN